MNITDAIMVLDKLVTDPSAGLSEELFFFTSRITPMVNVDLLIKDDQGRTLLSWRNDQYTGIGWHLPGGIIRFKETMKARLCKVVAAEIGFPVEFDPQPLAINEIILPQKIRGHFISFLFNGHPSGRVTLFNKGLRPTDAGYLQWHDSCPAKLLKCHEIYRKHI